MKLKQYRTESKKDKEMIHIFPFNVLLSCNRIIF